MHRRAFVGAAGAALLAAAPGVLRARRPPRKLDRLGLQLYTVRHDLARDFEGTIARVAEIGYREVEFAGYFGQPPRAVRALLERHGLSAPAAHLPIETLRGDWQSALEDAHVLGHAYVVVAWIPAAQRRTLGDYARLAELFNRAGEQASAAGLRFAYHNQDYEFASLAGRIPYDVLVAATDPRHVALELDLYWIIKGGGDPLTYFARYPGRFPMVHVKDMDGTPARDMTDVGRGVIDFKQIFDAGVRGGIQHYFVEHDHPADSFASVRASYEYLRRLEF